MRHRDILVIRLLSDVSWSAHHLLPTTQLANVWPLVLSLHNFILVILSTSSVF